MSWTIRITTQMLSEIRQDLARVHPHAAERVGFVFARMGNRDGPELQVLASSYSPIPDEDYLVDDLVGAKIGSRAIRRAMQTALSEHVGVFHVHMHEHKGRPRFSSVDLDSYPSLVNGFQNVAPSVAHGAMLLSYDSCECITWLPGNKRPTAGGRIVAVGRPMRFFGEAGGLYA